MGGAAQELQGAERWGWLCCPSTSAGLEPAPLDPGQLLHRHGWGLDPELWGQVRVESHSLTAGEEWLPGQGSTGFLGGTEMGGVIHHPPEPQEQAMGTAHPAPERPSVLGAEGNRPGTTAWLQAGEDAPLTAGPGVRRDQAFMRHPPMCSAAIHAAPLCARHCSGFKKV